MEITPVQGKNKGKKIAHINENKKAKVYNIMMHLNLQKNGLIIIYEFIEFHQQTQD